MVKKLDKKQKIELIVTLVGIVVLIFMILDISDRTQTKNAVKHKKIDMPGPPETYDIKGVTATGDAADKRKWGRDPFTFRTIDDKGTGLSSLELNGIVWDKYNPYAIVNNEVVKIGDVVNGMTVNDIREKEIVFDSGNEKYVLKLME